MPSEAWGLALVPTEVEREAEWEVERETEKKVAEKMERAQVSARRKEEAPATKGTRTCSARDPTGVVHVSHRCCRVGRPTRCWGPPS